VSQLITSPPSPATTSRCPPAANSRASTEPADLGSAWSRAGPAEPCRRGEWRRGTRCEDDER